MIAELYLIMDLLRDTVGDTPISPPSVKPQAVKQTKGSKANLAAGLFEVGPITEIKQQIIIPPISADQAAQWWLDATAGIPITSLPYTGKR